MRVFVGQNMLFLVLGQKTDLHLHNSELTIECNEKGHADRDVHYEDKRKGKIERKTGLWVHEI